MSISEPFAQYLVPVLDSIKSLADHISQVALVARPSLLYSKNYTKAVQTGGGFIFLKLPSLTIIHTTNVLAGDTRR